MQWRLILANNAPNQSGSESASESTNTLSPPDSLHTVNGRLVLLTSRWREAVSLHPGFDHVDRVDDSPELEEKVSEQRTCKGQRCRNSRHNQQQRHMPPS